LQVWIGLSIPFFMGLILIEYALSRRLRPASYSLSDTLTNLNCGVLDQLFALSYKAILFAVYVGVYRAAAIFELSKHSWATWILGFLLVDLGYYWWHRTSHEVNIVWAGHVVHHSSEKYNLSVALRQSLTAVMFSWIFYLPLAVIGIPPIVFAANKVINLLYQFWIHTELIGKLGPLEWVINTPSHHRVHHGVNPRYLDKNYAGTLIVWDRIFGSFEPESEPVIYGITKPINSWNPLWANFHFWAELIRQSFSKSRDFKTSLMAFLRLAIDGPQSINLIDNTSEYPSIHSSDYKPKETPRNPTLAILDFAPAGVGLFFLLAFFSKFNSFEILLAASSVIVAVAFTSFDLSDQGANRSINGVNHAWRLAYLGLNLGFFAVCHNDITQNFSTLLILISGLALLVSVYASRFNSKDEKVEVWTKPIAKH